MKRFLIAFAMIAAITLHASAMGYEQARERALFLTDKMAYELNLNDEQYEAAYEVNLDYLMSINSYDDLYGTYWTRRNLDLSYILFDWQYNAFCSAAYFYRPLVWSNGVWRFSIYSRYPHRSYFYFGRPDFYLSYHGGHSWHMNGGHSWYHGRTFGQRPGNERFGMRDRFDRGDFRGSRNHGTPANGNYNRQNRNNGGNYDRNNHSYDRNNEGQTNRNGNTNRQNNGSFSGGRNNNNSTNTGTNRWNRGNTGPTASNQPTYRRQSGVTTQRSSTRMTAERVQNSANSTVQERSAGISGQRFSGNTTTRPAQTFTPSRSTSSAGRVSSSGSRVSQSVQSHSSSASHGGGFSNGGSRSGGGGHFGGKR